MCSYSEPASVLYDGNTEKDKEALLAEFPAGSKVRIVLGELPEAEMEQLDLVVMSPGVPCDLPIVLAMKEKGIRIWGEVELAYECGKGDVLAVTGTNGKTTTTSLLGAIMQAYHPEVYIVGNIGNPYTEAAPKMTDDAVTVAEISSFQLEHHAGSSESTSHDGGVHPGQRADYKKSDRVRYVCAEL